LLANSITGVVNVIPPAAVDGVNVNPELPIFATPICQFEQFLFLLRNYFFMR
jgi:hypothetical protein